MKPRTNRSKIDMSLPVAPVEVALLEKLFDLSPDVASMTTVLSLAPSGLPPA